MKVSSPLLFVLALAICAQAICYIILEQNAIDYYNTTKAAKDPSMTPPDFFPALMNVYYMALGDFGNILDYEASKAKR